MSNRVRLRPRNCCAILAAIGVLTVHHDALAGSPSVRVDNGVVRTPAPVATHLATMPQTGGTGLGLGGSTSVNLGTFDIVIVPGATLSGNAAALAAFNRAAQQWEAHIADPITVTINADLAALGPGILGSTSSVTLVDGFNTVRNRVANDAADEPDDVVATLLPTAAQFTGFLPTGFTFGGSLQFTKANGKAIGYTGLDTTFGASDAQITFSTNFNFDFDNSNGIPAGQFDFESVAAHEIGHALGFISEVDFIDFLRSQNQTTNDVAPNTLDLFRFDDAAANDPDTLLPGEGSFTTEPRSLVPGNVEHFDQINNLFGGSAEVLFSTGSTQGDGQQASHWKDGLGLGLMDPTLAPQQIVPISANDRRAFDLIGYEVLIPEPSGVALLAAGTVLLTKRRRRD